ncbi:MAG: GntR family transcriptional regulator [Tissierellia bacterium]|nr:GntR family transcriptional regulator [Tissierellia bacterium]
MKHIDTGFTKYILVKQSILRYIEEHHLAMDSPLPSEREWAEMTGVSRLTVRRAITELANEGYVYVVHGRGTFVQSSTIQNNLYSLTSCTKDIMQQGRTPRKRVLLSEFVPASQDITTKLKINLGSPVFRLKRLYFADEHPIHLTTTHLVSDLVPNIEDYNFENISLYDVLENKMNITLLHAERYIKACEAPADIAALLEVRESFPLLYFSGIVYAKIGKITKPIETFFSYYRTDEFNFYINQVRV